RRRSKIALARLRPTSNSSRPSSRKLKSKSKMTTRLESSEVCELSGGNSVCINTKATSVAPAIATAINSRRRRLLSVRCKAPSLSLILASQQTNQERKQNTQNEAGSDWEIDAEIITLNINVAR